MPQLTVKLEVLPQRIKPFTFNEMEVKILLNTSETEPYWVECVFEAPAPLSLAPDKILMSGKSLVGILEKGVDKERRVKLFAQNDVYPDTYRIKSTLYIYDKDGAISERKDYYVELECGELNTKILQGV